MKKGDTQSIQVWVADIRRVTFQLTEIGISVPDEDIILVLTAGLPLSYEPLIVSLNAVSPDSLTLDFVISHLLNEESRQGIPASEPSSSAMVATRAKTPISQITCFGCQKKGHYKSHCPDADTKTASLAVENLAF